jgi:3-oxoadipate enol-lactonase
MDELDAHMIDNEVPPVFVHARMIQLMHRKKAEAGRTLVLIHAFPYSSKMWNELIPLLQNEAFGIATIDVAGFGTATTAEWTMPGVAKEIHDALASEEISMPVLCGLSMGGYIALAYAKAYPNDLSGLILADTKSAADPDDVKQDREKFAQDALKRGAIASVERNLDTMTSEATKRDRPEVVEQLRGWMLEADRQAIANALRAMAEREDTSDVLRTLHIAVLIIAGEEDPVTPVDVMEQMATLSPSAKVVRIPDASHMSVTEQPEAFAAAVREYLVALSASGTA